MISKLTPRQSKKQCDAVKDRRTRDWGVDLLFLILLAVAAVKFTYGLERVVDVHMHDETHYLLRGMQIRDGRIPSPDAAPLYSAWYLLLSLLKPERLSLYFLNWKLLTGLTALSFYALLRRWSSPLMTFMASCVFMTSTVNWDVWTKPAHFALVISLIALSVACRQRSVLSGLLVVSVGSLIAAYARPDFLLTFLLSMGIAAVVLTTRLRRHGGVRALVPFGGSVLFALTLLGVLGAPAFSPRTVRSDVAFGQHFSYNYWRWNNRPAFNPWTDWERVVTEHFGGRVGILEACHRNPAMAARHMCSNLKKLIPVVAELCVKRPNFVLPEDPSLHAIERVFWALVIIVILVAARRIRPGTREESVGRRWRALLFFGLFSIPGLLSSVAIYPKDYYLLLPTVLGVQAVLICLLSGENRCRLPPLRMSAALPFGLLVVLLVPSMSRWPAPRDGVPNTETLKFIKSLKLKGQIGILEAEGGLYVFLGGNFHRVDPTRKAIGFSAFLKENSVRMVLITDSLTKDVRFRDDPEWLSFLADPQPYGFTRHLVPNTNRDLFIETDLLPREPG